MTETYNAYRWAFIRMYVRHNWDICDFALILDYMKSCIYERNAMYRDNGEQWKEAHRIAYNVAMAELEEMMSAHALSIGERNVIRKLVTWPD